MADGIQIPITSTYSGAGVNQAIQDMSKLGSAMDMPGMKTAAVNSQVLAQRMDNATARAKVLGTELTALGRATPVERWQAFTTGVDNLAKSALRNAAVFTGVGIAVKKAYDFARTGAEIEFTRQKFDRLTLSVGDTGNAFLSDLRVATKGTVSDFGLLRQGADLLQLGLARDTTEAVRLSRVMTALGMDTGELTLALANQSKRRLDQLGLSLTAFNKIESKLKDSGMSKDQAFKEAFLQTAEQTVNITGNRADSSMGDFLKLEAGAANVWDSAKTSMANSSLVSTFSNALQNMNAVQRQDMAWNGNILELMFQKPEDRLRQGRASDFSNLWTGGGKTPYGASMQDRGGGAIAGLSGLQNYTAMAYAARNQGGAGLEGGAPGVEGEGAALDYEALLGGALKITSQTEKFTEATTELNVALAEENEKLDLMNAKYGEGSDKAAEQAKKVEGIKNNIKEVGAAAVDMGNNMVMSTLLAGKGNEQLALDYARATGQISESAAAQQSAILSIANAMQDTGLSADKAAGLVNKVMSWDGKQGFAAMTIYVNYVISGGGGGIGMGGFTYNPNSAYSQGEKAQTPIKDKKKPPPPGSFEAQASGGILGADMTLVGEEGQELIVKDGSRYVVIPADASKWLMEAGMVPGNKMAGGGTVGGRAVSRSIGGGRGGGYSSSRISSGSGRGSFFGGDITAGGGGDVSGIVFDTVSEVTPAITSAVVDAVTQTVANSPQMQAVSQSIETFKEMSDTLSMILAKTPSESGIGRAVNGDLARVA